MAGNVIVAGARTPMGRLLGSLKGFSAADLGGVAIAGALDRAGVAPEDVDYVIMGHVLQAGGGQGDGEEGAQKGDEKDLHGSILVQDSLVCKSLV